jgi:hypothetical protein
MRLKHTMSRLHELRSSAQGAITLLFLHELSAEHTLGEPPTRRAGSASPTNPSRSGDRRSTTPARRAWRNGRRSSRGSSLSLD